MMLYTYTCMSCMIIFCFNFIYLLFARAMLRTCFSKEDMSSTEGKKEDGVVNTTESKNEEGKKEGQKEETLEEKREQMSARAQRAAEGIGYYTIF